jgi:AraC-like DNA-binding protein
MVANLNRSEGAPADDHIDRVSALAEGRDVPAADDEISSSWQRCVSEYGVDPTSREAPRILTPDELRNFQEPVSQLIFDAREELDRLYSVVRQARYVVLLCDPKGIAVDHRGDRAEAEQFKQWGPWLGGVWTEELEGTNGIGTCVIDERPVTVHQSQHFRARHISLSCSGAPIFDADGRLSAVLDVSCIDPSLSEQSHALTGALTEASARAIQERSFRERFRQNWIIAIAPPDAPASAMLIAVDEDRQIIGADRNARALLTRNDLDFGSGASLWALFERQDALFRWTDHGDLAAAFTPRGTPEFWPAVVTPPAGPAARSGSDSASLHARPRFDAIGRAPLLALPARARGGLPPRVLRRVREYIEAHIAGNIELDALAAAAGLSVFHFARAFKQSTGMTPHSYVLGQRIKRAQELLASTDLPVASIALATGFSDQSHLARHFRAQVGVRPSAFRWSKR